MKKIVTGLLALLFVACAPAQAGLRGKAAADLFEIGAAVDANALANDAQYREVLAREFNLVTAENAMKFDATEPQRGVFDFTAGDRIVEFAEQNKMRVRGHTLLWHEALPNWLASGTFTRDELIEIMQNHIRAVMGHYKGKVFAWDVVNEIMNDGSSVWRQGIGLDYVLIAYETAREADPDALLFLNEYGAEGMNGKADAVYDLAKLLKERGLVDGVGMQMHVSAPLDFSQAEFEENLRRLGELGLIVHVTEMDVRIATPPTESTLQAQAEVYRQIMAGCAAVEACKAVVTWGFTDRYSWIPGRYNNQGAALPFDEDYQPKPAYEAMLQVLEGLP